MRRINFGICSTSRRGGKQKYWRVRIPASLRREEKPKDILFRTRAEAENARRELLAAYRAGELSRSSMLTAAELRDARRALDLLAEIGVSMSLEDVVRGASERLRAAVAAVSVMELFAAYEAEVSVARAWSAKYHSNWRFYVRRFLAPFGERNISDISAEELRDFFAANYTSAGSYNTALTIDGAAFAWAVRREMLAKSPFDALEKRKITARESVDVYTPREAERLLAACVGKYAAARPAVAILLFAGVRPTELTKLTWDDIRRDGKGETHIRISASIAKTRQIRLVRVRPTLLAFLRTSGRHKKSEKIIPKNWTRISRAIREAAGISNRPDAARHSFASYALAAGEAIADVESDLGHAAGSDVLFRHYRAAVTPSAAEKYWAIAPKKQPAGM